MGRMGFIASGSTTSRKGVSVDLHRTLTRRGLNIPLARVDLVPAMLVNAKCKYLAQMIQNSTQLNSARARGHPGSDPETRECQIELRFF